MKDTFIFLNFQIRDGGSKKIKQVAGSEVDPGRGRSCKAGVVMVGTKGQSQSKDAHGVEGGKERGKERERDGTNRLML